MTLGFVNAKYALMVSNTAPSCNVYAAAPTLRSGFDLGSICGIIPSDDVSRRARSATNRRWTQN